ncbi:MAG: bacterial Ig-like domain-containing protein [Clostridia bacterium]|nr:bacterial Ig-like domain-containing protein [Clostridia bacterium]
MKKKKLCSLLLATAMLSSVTAFTSCEALDSVLKVGENVFDNAFGAVDSVLGPIVDQFEDMFGNVVETPDDSSTPDEPSTKVSVKSIAIDTTEAKTEFNFAEEFTTEGVKVTATMSDGSTKAVDLKDCRIVKPDTTKPGTRTVTIVYGGQTARYEITVKTKVIPQISATSLLDITAENESVPYRVEAENIDMVTPGVKKAEGVTDFVATAPIDADITSGDKYLTGYNVQYNYFGFTFTANQQYESVTLVLRVANSTAADLNAGEMKMYLNFAQDENGNASGEISLDGYTIEANGAGKWTDIVLRGIDIPEGTNTLTFEVQGNKAFDLDYIDFYVGMRYINSIVEIADTTTIVKDLENFDTEKAFTRADVAAAHGLKDGQLFVEPTKDSEGKTTNNGTAVGAIGKGSQMSTTLRLAQNATVRIKMKASAVGKGAYFVADNWRFSIDGIELKMIERINIEGGNPGAGLWWDWIYTNVGEYNLPAGDHLFLVEVVSTDCNVDTFEFEVVSFGEYAEDGTDLDNQHACESVCEVCGKCLDEECMESACAEKCEGHTVAEEADLSINGQVGSTATIKAPNFNWENCDIVTRPDFIPAVGEGNCGKSSDAIYGFDNGSIFRIKLNVEAACTLNIYLEGFGGAAFSEYSWKFGNTVLTPAEGAQLAGSLSKVLVGTVSVAEAGVYTFEFSFGVNSDLYNVHFEAVDPASAPDAPSVGPEQPEVEVDATLGLEGTTTVEAETFDNSGVVTRQDFVDAGRLQAGQYGTESGNGATCIMGFTTGTVFTINVNAPEAMKVDVAMVGATDAAGYDISTNFVVTLNGETLTLPSGSLSGSGETPYWDWQSASFGQLTFAKGLNTITITINGHPNLDKLTFTVVEVLEPVEPEQPEVTPDVTIDGAGEYKMEGENVDKSTLVLRPDFAAAGIGFTESWSNDFGSGACLKGYTNSSVLKFTVDVKEATTLTLTMRMSHYENAVYDFSNITFTFAGQTLTPVAQGEFGHREASDYWKWVDVALGEVEVEAGIYTFEMNMVSGGNANIDYFMFKVEGEAEPEQPEVTPDITITDEATSYKVEAELLDMTTLVPQAGFEKPVVESFTGGQGLGGIGAGGYQTFTVKSVKDVNVALKIAFAKFEGGSILNFIGGVSVNGESLTLTDGEVAPGTSENQWWNVSNVQVATLKLTADTVYTFKIMVNSGNLDGYVLEVFEKTPETTNVASDITLATTGVTKYELENIDYTKSSINTRDDFVNAGVCVEGDVGRGSGRIYGFDNGSTFRVYVTVEAACILKISLAGFGGNALNAYKYSFGGVELTPAEGAVLGNGAVAEGVIGTVTVAEAGVYCFEFTSGISVDLDYVAFEVVEA